MAVLSGHNSGTSEELFLSHVNKLRALEAEKQSIMGKIRAAKKIAKDDGVVLGDLNWALKIAEADPAEAAEQHNRRLAYLRYLRAPIGTQMSFLEDVDSLHLSDEERATRWHDEGFSTGARGGNRHECPHDPNSEAGRKWMDGYQAAQDQLAKGFKQMEARDEQRAANGEAEPDEAPKKRGRMPKKKTADGGTNVVPLKPPTPSVSNLDDWGDSNDAVATPPAPPV